MAQHSIRAENAALVYKWITDRGGIAVWRSASLINPGMSWTTPVNDGHGVAKGKPYRDAQDTPERIITSTDDVLVHNDVEVGRLKIHLRLGAQGFMVKLTDASTAKVNKAVAKAGEHAYHLFDYDTQEAVILAPDGNSMTLTKWAETHKPTFYECGICDHLHPIDFDGDCRDNASRFTEAQLDEHYGANGWASVEMPQ